MKRNTQKQKHFEDFIWRATGVLLIPRIVMWQSKAGFRFLGDTPALLLTQTDVFSDLCQGYQGRLASRPKRGHHNHEPDDNAQNKLARDAEKFAQSRSDGIANAVLHFPAAGEFQSPHAKSGPQAGAQQGP